MLMHDPYDSRQQDFGCYVMFKGKMQSFTLQKFYIPHLTVAHLTGCILQFFFIQMLYFVKKFIWVALYWSEHCAILGNTPYIGVFM